MKSIIYAVIGIVIGAGATYFYQQGPMTELSTRATALESQLTESKTMATTAADAAAAEISGLQDKVTAMTSEVADKAKMAEDLQAKISELEAELATAKAAQ